jgi:hypothetical protein
MKAVDVIYQMFSRTDWKILCEETIYKTCSRWEASIKMLLEKYGVNCVGVEWILLDQSVLFIQCISKMFIAFILH